MGKAASAFLLLVLTTVGCSQQAAIGAGAAAIYLTRSEEKTTQTNTSSALSEELWCYRTLGYPECYTSPQDVVPNRLINVTPQKRYPHSAEKYYELVEQKAGTLDAPNLAAQQPVPTKTSQEGPNDDADDKGPTSLWPF
ncbi:MAG: hypothetical protein PHS57_07520 [Alphaproteobacteria bacterium]|nr:hypothetical protein [Alphaproteobacteria bacterium]